MTTDIFDVIDATWPAARMETQGDWTFRSGDGGGKRVSAVTAAQKGAAGDVSLAEAGQDDLGQPHLFQIRPGDEVLDAVLDARGYGIVDPVVVFSCPAAHLADIPIPRVTVFPIWEPLAIMDEIWMAGGIGPARRRVMDRVRGPKTALFARRTDKPAGVGFAAIHDKTAMVHAVEIAPDHRRQGMGRWIMRAAAIWAVEQGADNLMVMCTKENAAAVGLYSSLGMTAMQGYHYRLKSQEE